jgi:hypothetical protein
MAAPFSFVCFDVEDAVKAYIQSVSAPNAMTSGVTLYTTADAIAAGEELVEPYIAINCEDAAPVEEMSGLGLASGVSNESVTVNLYVRTHGQDSDAAEIVAGYTARQLHKEICGKTLDMIRRTDLVTVLNAVAGDVQFVQIDMPRTKTTISDRSYITTITMQAHVYPRDASA